MEDGSTTPEAISEHELGELANTMDRNRALAATLEAQANAAERELIRSATPIVQVREKAAGRSGLGQIMRLRRLQIGDVDYVEVWYCGVLLPGENPPSNNDDGKAGALGCAVLGDERFNLHYQIPLSELAN